MKKTWQVVVTVVVVGALAFFGGMKYAGGATKTGGFGQGGQRGGAYTAQKGGEGGGRIGGGGTIGQVLSMDDKSITLKLASGGSKIIFFSKTTPVMKSVSVTQSDVKEGLTLMVSGKVNADGSVTADNILIRPAMPAAKTDAPTDTAAQTK